MFSTLVQRSNIMYTAIFSVVQVQAVNIVDAIYVTIDIVR